MVFVAGGRARLVVRRETLDDLVRLDVDSRSEQVAGGEPKAVTSVGPGVDR